MDYGINMDVLKRKAGCDHTVTVSEQLNGRPSVKHGKRVKNLGTVEMEGAWVTAVIDWIRGLHEPASR